MADLVKVRRALVSVSDKTDLAPFARALAGFGVEIVSTGGTARALSEAGIDAVPIERLTGFPEILGGRVKTLHPAVHAGLLALRDDPDHERAMQERSLGHIDLLCVNLYPFERVVAAGVPHDEAIENIDIGGPSMLRSGAKNYASVAVVAGPQWYDRVISQMREHDGATTLALRAELAAAAFARTAEYDSAISAFLSRRAAAPFPESLRLTLTKASELRYGENPHQDAALYRDPASTGPTVVNAQVLHGKPLSYNNILDAAAALELVKDLRRLDPARAGAAVVKHTNACGAALAHSAADAVEHALRGDPLAAYGGILAVNRPIDAAAAQVACREGVFLEVIIAPAFDDEALAALRARSANVRLLATGDRPGSAARKMDYRSVPGGLLVQDRDTRTASPDQWIVAAGPQPGPERLAHAAAVWTMVKHLKSNAVAIGGPDAGPDGPALRLLGSGAGLVDRVTACRLAVEKAGDAVRACAALGGAIAASDAFFPFADGPRVLIDAGVTTLVHPGGSKRDEETIDLCRRRGVTCLLTGVRHFRH